MKPDRAHLGDRHNCGQSVRFVSRGTLHKPRPVYLERLFLAECDFRSSVNQIFDIEGEASPFSWLPKLSFGGADLYEGGLVEEIKVREIDGRLSSSDFEGIGCVVALFVWFGIGDLHSQNIMTGRAPASGQFIFTPVDIECGLEKLIRPSDALFTPGKLQKNFCGLWPILHSDAQAGAPKTTCAAAMVHGFYCTMRILHNNKELIDKTFLESVDLAKARVRVIPRDTKTYSRRIESGCFCRLFECEIEQLLRGDIPYYYKYMDSGDVYYMSAGGHKRAKIHNHQWGISYPEYRNISQTCVETHASHEIMLHDGVCELLRLYAMLQPIGGRGSYKSTKVAIGKSSFEVSIEGEALCGPL